MSKPGKIRNSIKIPMLIGFILCAVLFASYAIIRELLDFSTPLVFIIFLAVFIYTIRLSFYAMKKADGKISEREENNNAFNGEVYKIFREAVDLPYVINSSSGRIISSNRAMENLLGKDIPIGTLVSDFCSTGASDIISNSSEKAVMEVGTSGEKVKLPELGNGVICNIGEHRMLARSYPVIITEKQCHLITFRDITFTCDLYESKLSERTAVAFVIIDDADELLQYVKGGYRSAANSIEVMIRDWAASLNAILREYDRDKYMLILSKEKLDECIKDKFRILDKIRNIRIGEDNMSITVSIGISAGEGTLVRREKEAADALELALSRGGDQVAIVSGNKTEFYGGYSKSSQRRSKVRSRVSAELLCARITESSNVLIMGHKNPDFDSIGSCIGVARLCMFCGVPAKIVVDTESENFKAIEERFSSYSEYNGMFVSGISGLDEIRPDTLLIVCDTNNFSIVETPEIADNVDRIAIIDHHRQISGFIAEPLVCYIDPAASSTCEMLSEILELSLGDSGLLREEANALLSGIMLDTAQFTKETGARTFSAALYLQKSGARTESARSLFVENLEDYRAESEFCKDFTVYRDNIAITVSHGSGNDERDRVAASKTADSLLGIKGIDAAFALVPSGNQVRISARSKGQINVQLILEKLGGGGHFAAAGAEVGSTVDSAVEILKGAIDGYLDER